MKALKKSIAGLTAAGMLLTATGCGGNDSASNAASDVTTLTFWNGFTASDGDILREIVDGFNESHDNIQIEMDIMPWANFNENLPPAISSGTAPDFVLMNYGDFAQYVENGAVRALDDFWDFDGVDKSDFTETSIELGIVNGEQYFIPMQVQGMYFYWNKDLFEAAGLDPEQPPRTWSELAEMAPKLVDSDTNVSGFSIPVEGNAILYNWMLANGGSLVNDDFTESTFDSEENLEVLKAIQEMFVTEEVGPQNIGGAEADNLMNAGQLAMFINGPWLNNGLQANEINYGVTTIPQISTDGEKTAILDGVGFAIPVSTDESKTEAIFEFISYWNTTEIGKKWSLENGFPPYLKSVAADSEVANDPIVSELIGQIEFAEPFLPGFSKLPAINNDIINPLIERLLSGGDPEELMSNAHEQINNLLAQ